MDILPTVNLHFTDTALTKMFTLYHHFTATNGQRFYTHVKMSSMEDLSLMAIALDDKTKIPDDQKINKFLVVHH